MTDWRKTRLCAAALAGILILSGCGNRNKVVNYEEPRDDVVDITFFGNKYEPENVTVIEEIISDFMRDNPDIRVSYESLKGSAYYEALKKRMAVGKGDDVFMVNHDAALLLKEEGMLTDLSGLDVIANYTEQMAGQMEEEDGIYWLPTTVSAFGLYCNLDLLREHGRKIPENLGEWKDTCDYFTGRGITPVIANNDISLKTLAIGLGFFPVYQENRQEKVYERLNRGEEELSDYLYPGVSLAAEMIEKGYIDAEEALHTEKTSDDLEEFIKGEAPFMLTGAWAAGRVAQMEPDFEFVVAPYPVLEDGSVLVINPDTRLGVNAGSEHPKEALLFVEYFTRAEYIREFAGQQSSFSPLKGGGDSASREIKPLKEAYEAGRIVIGSDSLLAIPIWDLGAEASRKLLAGESPEKVMDWLDRQAEEVRGVQR